ncbi:MAG: AAA family ATPase [Acidobacteriia bacterium]|nr:AAA family ATPase [Terriglobia bacterium]
MISRIRIRNFKSFEDVDVTLGLTNVLVGPNMSGKSNFIDAFRFLVDLVVPSPNVQGISNAVMKRNGFREVVWKGGSSGLISFNLEGISAETTEAPVKWTYNLEILGEMRYGSANVQREELTLDTPTGQLPLISTKDGRRVLHRTKSLGTTEINDSGRLALEYEIPDWEGNFIRASIAAWRFYRLIPTSMRQANPSAAAPFLTEYGDNLSSWLLLLQTRYSDQFNRIVTACREVFPDLEDVLSWPTQQSTVYLASRERHLSSPTTVWQMSDGELAFIALLSLIFAPKDLGAPLYCIEEPENYLHPRLLTVLTELLKQVQGELGAENSAQLLISTHSPMLIDRFSIDNLILFRRERGATKCVRPRDNESFKALVDSGEIGLGELYYSGALARA